MQPSINPRWVAAVVVGLILFVILSNPRNRLWHGPGAEPEIMSFEDDDKEMNSAMEEARKNVETFIVAVSSPKMAQSHHSVKVGFRDEHGNEYIWLNDVRYRDGVFIGTIGNIPQTVRSVHFGDPVTVSAEKIADWMYLESQKLIGGYTMRVMRDRLSDKERQAFDAQIGFQIE